MPKRRNESEKEYCDRINAEAKEARKALIRQKKTNVMKKKTSWMLKQMNELENSSKMKRRLWLKEK